MIKIGRKIAAMLDPERLVPIAFGLAAGCLALVQVALSNKQERLEWYEGAIKERSERLQSIRAEIGKAMGAEESPAPAGEPS